MAQFPDLYICKGVISRSDGGLGITCVVFARGLVRDHPTPSPYKKTNGVVVGIRKKQHVYCHILTLTLKKIHKADNSYSKPCCGSILNIQILNK